MSINLCSINSTTVLSICAIDRQIGGVSRQTRKVVLDNLIAKANTVRRKAGGNGSTVNPAAIQRIRDTEKDFFGVNLKPELDEITVIIEFGSDRGIAKQDNVNSFDFVMIDDFDDGSLNYSATITNSETISVYQDPLENASVDGTFIDDDLDGVVINITGLKF